MFSKIVAFLWKTSNSCTWQPSVENRVVPVAVTGGSESDLSVWGSLRLESLGVFHTPGTGG